MAAFDDVDAPNRLVAMLPQSWADPAAFQPGGGIYAIMQAAGTTFTSLYAAVQYVRAQSRLLTATGQNLEAIANDFFGYGNFPRGIEFVGGQNIPEPDASYAYRIQQNLIAPRNTLAAIQNRVQLYLNDFFQSYESLNSRLLGLGTAGGLGTWGRLGGQGQDVPIIPTCTAFDIQSNPYLAGVVGLTTGEFCLLFTYGGLQKYGLWLGHAFLGATGAGTGGSEVDPSGSFLIQPNIEVLDAAPTPDLAALVQSCKPCGMKPVYADNRGA